MRIAYLTLARLITVLVVVQAAVIAWAIFGLGHWIEGGGVLDKAVMESDVTKFPEENGFMIHGMNGQMVIPAVAVLLLVVSFFAKVNHGKKLALIVVVLVAAQVAMGIFGHGMSWLGLVHGLNAFLIFGASMAAAMAARVGQHEKGAPA